MSLDSHYHHNLFLLMGVWVGVTAIVSVHLRNVHVAHFDCEAQFKNVLRLDYGDGHMVR